MPQQFRLVPTLTLSAATLFFQAAAFASAADVPPAAPNVRVIEEIVAKVNNDIITRGELEKMRAQIEAEVRAQKGLSGAELEKEVKARHADALRDKIDQLLLVQKGKDLNIKVDAEITRRIAEIQAQSKISDPDKFHEWVRQQSGGLPFEDVRQNMVDQALTQKVIGQEVGSKINVPQSDIQKYYDEHKAEFVREEMVFLREILIAPTDKSPAALAAAEKKAKGIVDRARKGEKFTQLARDYSAAETANNDGELGAFKRGELTKQIEDQVFTQAKGFVTDPIQTPNGYEIVRVDERYAAGQASLDEVKNEVMDHLYTPRMKPALRTFLTQLRQDAFLEIRGGYVDSGAAPNKNTAWQDPAQLKPETTTKEEVAARKKKKMLGIIPKGGASGNKLPPPTPTVTPIPPAPTVPPVPQP
jgi:peptidyl-prolyl cis-trans isomerase SurA